MKQLCGVVLLSARTSRARAYAQALAAAGMQPECLVLYGAEKGPFAVDEYGGPWPRGVAPIDLCETLEALAERLAWPVQRVNAESVSAPEVAVAVAACNPDLVIYAGAGGQLVPAGLLEVAPFLHIHSGWLPDYRGSTTLYYSLLENGTCACTALLLDPHIDTGPIVARRHYPAPPSGLNVDHVYDGAIRANLLVRVMRAYLRLGRLPSLRKQPAAGRTFYVIHPVLKHLALLSLASRQPAESGQ